MAKTTVAKLDERVTSLENCVGAFREEVTTQIDKLKDWLGNGFTEKVSGLIAAKSTEQQVAMLQAELENQKEENRKYGKVRDDERIVEQAAAERKNKILIALLGSGGPVTAIIMWLLMRGGS